MTWSEKILPTNGSIRIHGVGSRGLRVRLAAHLVTSNPLDFPRKQSHKSVKQFFLVVTGPWKRRKITQNRLYECYPDCRSIEYITFRVRAPPILSVIHQYRKKLNNREKQTKHDWLIG